MIFCPTQRELTRLELLMLPVPDNLISYLFDKGLSIRVIKDSPEAYLEVYTKLKAKLIRYSSFPRYPHESSNFDPTTKTIFLRKKDLYGTYNIALHELGHAVDFLYSDNIEGFMSSTEYVRNILLKTGHLSEYTLENYNSTGLYSELFAVCFQAFFSEREKEYSYGHHHIDELHPETIEFFKKYMYF